jgi:hypothetical protein
MSKSDMCIYSPSVELKLSRNFLYFLIRPRIYRYLIYNFYLKRFSLYIRITQYKGKYERLCNNRFVSAIRAELRGQRHMKEHKTLGIAAFLDTVHGPVFYRT